MNCCFIHFLGRECPWKPSPLTPLVDFNGSGDVGVRAVDRHFLRSLHVGWRSLQASGTSAQLGGDPAMALSKLPSCTWPARVDAIHMWWPASVPIQGGGGVQQFWRLPSRCQQVGGQFERALLRCRCRECHHFSQLGAGSIGLTWILAQWGNGQWHR